MPKHILVVAIVMEVHVELPENHDPTELTTLLPDVHRIQMMDGLVRRPTTVYGYETASIDVLDETILGMEHP